MKNVCYKENLSGNSAVLEVQQQSKKVIFH